MKVLLVKLPEDISRYIQMVLRVRWPDLTLLHTEQPGEALELIHKAEPHFTLLHLPEPDDGAVPGDCFELINKIRGFSELPIIVVGESTDITERVKALETGADDWISPSFIPMEFIAKVNAILRRCAPHKPGLSLFLDGKLSIDHASHRVCIYGKPIKLTPIQYRIFSYLARNQGRVCTSTELLQHVWGPNSSDDKDLLKLNVYRLRSRVEEDPSNPELIVNERGTGYIIRAPATSQ